MKSWRLSEAEKYDVAASTVAMWIKRRKYRLKLLRVNDRVIYVLGSKRVFKPQKRRGKGQIKRLSKQ